MEVSHDWSVYIAMFVAGAFPWISEIKNLNYHFNFKDTELKTIFNTFASLFAFSIFFFIKNSLPVEMLEYLNTWPFILIVAFALVTIYLTIFFNYKVKGEIKIGTLITAFCLYVFIFCTLSGGFSLLYIKKDYHIIPGATIATNGSPVEAIIELVDSSQNTVRTIRSDSGTGKFKLILRKTLDIRGVNVYAAGYGDVRQEIQNDELFDVLHNIDLTPDAKAVANSVAEPKPDSLQRTVH